MRTFKRRPCAECGGPKEAGNKTHCDACKAKIMQQRQKLQERRKLMGDPVERARILARRKFWWTRDYGARPMGYAISRPDRLHDWR